MNRPCIKIITYFQAIWLGQSKIKPFTLPTEIKEIDKVNKILPSMTKSHIDRTQEDRTEEDRTEEDRTEEDRTEEDRTEEDRTQEDKTQ